MVGLGNVISVATFASPMVSAVPAVLSRPEMAGVVEDAASRFMLGSPAALAFARKSLPGNGLLKRASDFGNLEKLLTAHRGTTKQPSLATVGAGGVAGVGAKVFYPRLARFLDSLPFFRAGREGREAKAVLQWLQDPAAAERFFADAPEEYLGFLRGTVSETFRTEEGKTRIRLDTLRGKIAEARRMEESRLREIEVAGISETMKETLKARIRESTRKAASALETAIQEEEAFIARLDAFIAEVAGMAEALQREVADANVYAAVEEHAARMVALTGAALEAEEARIEALVDLARYWERLREMGDEVVNLQLARAEVSRALLEGNP